MVLGAEDIYRPKNKRTFDLSLIFYPKINLKWIINLKELKLLKNIKYKIPVTLGQAEISETDHKKHNYKIKTFALYKEKANHRLRETSW